MNIIDLKCIETFDEYILESANVKDNYVNDFLSVYRFPNNYGIILAYHELEDECKYSVDFVVFDSREDNHETYITIDKYNSDYNEMDVYDEQTLESIFIDVFSLPIHIKVTSKVKQALSAVSKLNSDEKQFIIDQIKNNTINESE